MIQKRIAAVFASLCMPLAACRSEPATSTAGADFLAWKLRPQLSFCELPQWSRSDYASVDYFRAADASPLPVDADWTNAHCAGWRIRPGRLQRIRRPEEGSADDLVEGQIRSVELTLVDARDERRRLVSAEVAVGDQPVDVLVVLSRASGPGHQRSGQAEIYLVEPIGLRLLARGMIADDALAGDLNSEPPRWPDGRAREFLEEGRSIPLCFWSWADSKNDFNDPALRWQKDHGGFVGMLVPANSDFGLFETPLTDWPSPVLALLARPSFAARS